ncbi:Crp/Fnr family transcriptional regulator [Chitinophaga rhizosphaerae]|uniref:Crp/Fnr family transcriptional regulator n=1 Tax=Chitinophaga rhizosphaerae TaxID=1864947 RepID=UPI0013E092A2|nr:Crp/Fnr family transcriptional regulator [Chitinophaga rhizosphaerae]
MTMEPTSSCSPDIRRALDFFTSVSPLSSAARDALSHCMALESFPRKHCFQQAKRPATHLFMVAKGLVRSFYQHNNRDITLLLGMESCIVCAMDSLLCGKPAYYNIETLEDSDIISISYADLERLYSEFHEIERLGRLMISQYYLELDQSLRSQRFLSARERYQELMEKQPELLQRAPLQFVASYLGMSAETLSRIRG